MPRRPASLPAHDPERFVHFLQRGRMRFDPNLVPALLAWLSMQEEILTSQIAEMQGRSNQLPSAVRTGMVKQLENVVAGVRLLADSVTQPWRRVEWYRHAAKVMDAIGATDEPTETQVEG